MFYRNLPHDERRFYTNITHELRILLMLILGPLEDLLCDVNLPVGNSVKYDSAKNIEIDCSLKKKSWDEQVSFLVQCWIRKYLKMKKSQISVHNKNRLSQHEKATKTYETNDTSKNEKVYQSDESKNTDYQQYDPIEDEDLSEKGYKFIEGNRPSSSEIPTKLPNKKLRYIIIILQ